MREVSEFSAGQAARPHLEARLAGISDDGSRMIMCNDFNCVAGRLTARMPSAAGWRDLADRKLVAPPEALLEVMRSLGRTGDFAVLPGSTRS